MGVIWIPFRFRDRTRFYEDLTTKHEDTKSRLARARLFVIRCVRGYLLFIFGVDGDWSFWVGAKKGPAGRSFVEERMACRPRVIPGLSGSSWYLDYLEFLDPEWLPELGIRR